MGPSARFIVDNDGDVVATSYTAGFSSTTFFGEDGITKSTSSAFTIDVAGGDAVGEDLIVTADNFEIDASGNVTISGTLSAGEATFDGDLDLKDNNVTNVGTVDGVNVSAHAAAGSGVHFVAGSFVGTDGSQTLKNKTLTAPTIADFSNATHSHTDNMSGGGSVRIVPGSAQDITSAATSVIYLNENSPSSPNFIEVEVGGIDKFVVKNAGGVTATSFTAGFASTVLADGSLSTSGDLAVDVDSGNGEFTIDAMNISIDGNGDISPVGLVDGVDIEGHDHGGGLGGTPVDHGGLTGNADDDHLQYLERDGSDAMSGNFDVGTNKIINVSTVDGVNLSDHAAAGSGVHGVTGSVVGNSDSQTLTNKTLTTPTIGDFSNATHSHTGNSGGGVLSGLVLVVPGSAQTIASAATTLGHLNETSGSTPNLMELEVGGTDKFAVDNQGNVMANSFTAGSATTVFADGSLTSGGNFSVDAGSGNNDFTVNAMNIGIDGNGDISPVGLVDGINLDQHFHKAVFTESFVLDGQAEAGSSIFAGPGIQFPEFSELHFMVCNSDLEVTKMYVHAETPPGFSESADIIARLNGSDTNMTVTLGAGVNDGSDTTNSFFCLSGQRLDIEIDCGNCAQSVVEDVSVTLEFEDDSLSAENP